MEKRERKGRGRRRMTRKSLMRRRRIRKRGGIDGWMDGGREGKRKMGRAACEQR